MKNEKLGEMTVEEDTDGKAVWVFEGKIKTDVPLETESDTIVEAINELVGKLQDAGGGDDWYPPDWWLPVPEPRENEVLILVDIVDNPQSYHSSGWGYMHDGTNNYHGTYAIDYGNGVITTVESGNATPTDINAPYSAKGQYIISMTSEDRFFYRPVDNKYNSVLMVKCGANISCKNSGIAYGYNAYNLYRMQFIQFGGEPYIGNGFLSSAKCIKKVKYLNSPAEIPEYSFNGLSTLEYLEGVDDVASIGQYGFSGCSSLQKIRTLSEDCTVGRDAFMGCYSMPYPRPDGSTT